MQLDGGLCILLYCPIESHRIFMSSIALLCLAQSYQLPCCNFFTQHAMFVYLRRTPLMNYGPGPIFTIDTSSTVTVYLLQTITFYTIRLNLCYSKPVSLTTSLIRWDKVLSLCCEGLHVATSTGSTRCQSSASNTFEVFPCSYWFD